MKIFRTVSECRLWFGIPDIKVLVVKRKKKFLMKYANSANGLCQLFGIGALSEYMHNIYKCIFLVLFIPSFSTNIYGEIKLCILLPDIPLP